MAVKGSTRLFPQALLEHLQHIESVLGRQRDIDKGPRTIDLDILLYGDAVISTGQLTVPHPHLSERAFVLAPLAEIAPGLVHPLLRTNMAALLAAVVCNKQVVKKSP
jgi:2-amino-4-hydroxy-6-hydroxymethyldihydropteridine diphosphokinase